MSRPCYNIFSQWMTQPSPTFLEVDPLTVIGNKNDKLVSQIVLISWTKMFVIYLLLLSFICYCCSLNYHLMQYYTEVIQATLWQQKKSNWHCYQSIPHIPPLSQSVATSARGQLQLSEHLSPTTQQALVIDDLRIGTLISLLLLCDDDCMEIFTRCNVKTIKNNNVIITGKCEPNGLWSIPLLPRVHQWSDKNKHQSGKLSPCFTWKPCQTYPAQSYTSRPPQNISGINNKTHLQTSGNGIATALGHQDQEQKIYGLHKNHLLQNQQSTMLTLTWLQLMNPVQTSYVLCYYHQSDFGLILTKQEKFLSNPAVWIPKFWSYIIMTQTLSMQHPFLTGKLQPFAMHGNPPTKH